MLDTNENHPPAQEAPAQASQTKPLSGAKPPPPPLLCEPQTVMDNWKIFKQRWTNYSILTAVNTQPREYQVALLLYTLGDEALKIYNGLQFNTPETDRTVAEIIGAFDKFALEEQQKKDGNSRQCIWCGEKHARLKNQCPAYGTTCSTCQQQNHFAKMCLQKKPRSKYKTRAHHLQDESYGTSAGEEFIDTIATHGNSKDIKCSLILPNKTEVIF